MDWFSKSNGRDLKLRVNESDTPYVVRSEGNGVSLDEPVRNFVCEA